MLDKKDLSRKYVAHFYQEWGENLVEGVLLNQVTRTEAAVPRMLRRLVLFRRFSRC